MYILYFVRIRLEKVYEKQFDPVFQTFSCVIGHFDPVTCLKFSTTSIYGGLAMGNLLVRGSICIMGFIKSLNLSPRRIGFCSKRFAI